MINLIFLFLQKAYALTCGTGFIAVSLNECAPDPNFVPSLLSQITLSGVVLVILIIIGIISFVVLRSRRNG